MSPTSSPRNDSSIYSPPQSPEILSPSASRRDSVLSRHNSMFPSSPVSTSTYGSQYQSSQWLPTGQNVHSPLGSHPTPSNTMVSGSPMANMGQNSLPMNYNHSTFQTGSMGSHRSYSDSYDNANKYHQHHHY